MSCEIKCDRCGAPVKRGFFEQRPSLAICRAWIDMLGDKQVRVKREYDLCRNCLIDLADFMNEKKEAER